MTQHEIATWGMNMKAPRMPALVLSALLSLTAGAHSDHVAAPSPRVDPLPRDLEIQLAMSALPRHLRDHATGRWPDNPDPFVILHGVHGYTIQFLGVTERAAVNKEYEALLVRLCKIKDVWCLPE